MNALIVGALLLVSSPEGEARALFEAGKAAYEAGHHAAAAHALEQSYELWPRPLAALWLAESYRVLFFTDEEEGHLDRAIALYRLYLDQAPQGRRRTDAIIAIATLEPIRARIALQRGDDALAPQEPITFNRPTRLIVLSPNAGALAQVDGGPVTAVPMVAEVTAGRHTVRVSAPGFEPSSRPTDAAASRVTVVEVALAEQNAEVWMDGESGALVYIDGKFSGQLPLTAPLSVAPGRHHVWVARAGREPWSRYIEADRGGRADVAVRMQSSFQRDVAYVVMAGGAITVGAAGVFGILALRDNQSATLLDDERERRALTAAEAEEFNRRVSRARSRGTTAWAFFGVGTTVGVAGALLYLLDAPPDILPGEETFIGVMPVLGDATGIAIEGRF